MDQLDDQLCPRVIEGRLPGENFDPRRMVFRLRPHRSEQSDCFEHVEQLAFVFVDALDVHVEQRRRFDAHTCQLVHALGQSQLVMRPRFPETPDESGVSCE